MHPLITANQAAIAELCRKHHVVRLWLFGSAARGDFDPSRSDLDFLVEFAPDKVRRGFGGDYWGLMRELRQLLDRPVDLVEPEAIRNPYFRKDVEQTRVALYAA